MKKSLLFFLIVMLPALLFANVYQAYRYSRLEREVALLEMRQHDLIERNKRAILAISVLTSPDRIGPLAMNELELERLDPRDLILLDTPNLGGTE
jgi:cell division protein FtsL